MIDPDASQTGTEYKSSQNRIHMADLWRQTLELCRHAILWLPCIFASFLATVVWRVRGVAEKWIFEWFTTSRSVFGSIQIPDLDHKHRIYAAIAYLPLGSAAELACVWLFVFALAATSRLVGFVVQEQEPDLKQALKTAAPRWRQISWFSLKCLLAYWLFALVISLWAFLPERIVLDVLGSPIFLSLVAPLLFTVWAAWLLVPATVRLLGSSGLETLTGENRRQE